MKRIENECADCGLPCLGDSCPNRNVVRLYCDKCNEEKVLYHYDSEELCGDCILKRLDEVNIEDD